MAEAQKRVAELFKRPEPITWLFAGDSIAQGAVHTMGWRDFTEHFRERVRWELQRRRDCVINTAISGWRVSNLNDDLQWSILRHKPDVVLVYIGMNDCTLGADGLQPFREGYLNLIRSMRDGGVGEIVVQTPNRVQPADAVRYPHVRAYAETIREVAAHEDVLLVDHFAAWESAEKSESMAYWLSDPCHPNYLGHRAMAHTIFRTLGIWDDASRTCRQFVP